MTGLERLRPWREVMVAVAVAAAGMWLATRGGPVLLIVGTVVVAGGGVWAVTAHRRMQFHQEVDSPGVVEVVEGQIGYLGPQVGGFVALDDLVDLRLVHLRGRRLWRLRQSDGQAILIPVDAAGADALFDAFVSLPGMDSAALVAALHPVGTASGQALVTEVAPILIWSRATALSTNP
jgi:hypothetical protein